MSPETLQTLSQVAVVIGIVLTGLSGFGAYYYGRVAQDAKDSAAVEREGSLRANVDKLVAGNETL